MQRSRDFSLFTISDIPYLLPFGQGIADQKRGVQINDTGAYLWSLLDRERTEEEMLSLCADHYRIPASQLPQLKTELQQFLRILNSYGMLNRTADSHSSSDCNTADIPASADLTDIQTLAEAPSEKACTSNTIDAACEDAVQRYLSVGGLTLLLLGPAMAFSRDFDAFEIFPDSDTISTDVSKNSPFHVDQTILVADHAPAKRPRGNILLQNAELTVMENKLQYIFLFPNAPGIHEAHLTKDGAEVRCYCCPPYTEDMRTDLFHAIRLSFLYLAQLHDMLVLHSASLLYRDRAWLFSGHSGAGKSTHTNLWKELYNVPLINGDLNLLSMENGRPMIHGLPWCGTSGIADTRSYPLGGIILVKKAPNNCADSPDSSHSQLLVAQRLISPSWTEALVQKNLCLVAKLAPHILICRLRCTKAPEAAETAKQAIDEYLDRTEG